MKDRERDRPRPRSGLIVASLGVVALVPVMAVGPFPCRLAAALSAASLPLIPLLAALGVPRPAAYCAAPVLGAAIYVVVMTTVVVLGASLAFPAIVVVLGAIGLVGLAGTAVLRPAVTLAAGDAAAVAFAGVVSVLTALAGLRTIGNFPPSGSDWGNYLLYAEFVHRDGRLFLSDPYSFGGGFPFAGDSGLAGLLASVLSTDGIAVDRLVHALPFVHALFPLALFAVGFAFWGRLAATLMGVLAAFAPVGWWPFDWHGLSVAVGLVALALLLMFVGLILERRGRWLWIALAAVLGATFVCSRPTGVFAFTFVGLAVLVEAARAFLDSRDRGSRLRAVTGRPEVVELTGACILGLTLSAAAVYLYARQASELGRPPSVSDFRAHGLLDAHQVVTINGWSFAVFGVLAAAVVVTSRIRTGALRSVVVYVAAAILLSQAGVVGVSYDYTRPAAFLGIAILCLGGAAVAVAGRAQLAVLLVVAAGAVYVSRTVADPSLQSPRFVYDRDVTVLREARSEHGVDGLVLADDCASWLVPYLARLRTLPALGPGQSMYGRQATLATDANRILAGGPTGLELARARDVRYAVTVAGCGSGTELVGLGPKLVARGDNIVIYRLSEVG